MTDTVGSKEAFLTTAQKKFNDLKAVPGITRYFKKQKGLFMVYSKGRKIIVVGNVGTKAKHLLVPRPPHVEINGTVWTYEMHGVHKYAAIATCVAVARAFGDLEKTAALTYLLPTPSAFATDEPWKILGLYATSS